MNINQAVEAMYLEPPCAFNNLNGMPRLFFKMFNGTLFGDSPLSTYGIYRKADGTCFVARIDLASNSYKEQFNGTRTQCLRYIAVRIKNTYRKNRVSANSVYFLSHIALINKFFVDISS